MPLTFVGALVGDLVGIFVGDLVGAYKNRQNVSCAFGLKNND
jgi:hypothetical protein